ncbi:helix-turn-helix domain-containing protein [Neorhizobium sp. NCHU2750]|uniref:helix-turn-helix domain-containing protein n=1 Tax=Neorhizobium sp. NCHU2750 TaxID=1825976 RepID=UPI000E762B1C|nr:transcriptional regulator [Neorhizobium sp. NCHU2750]
MRARTPNAIDVHVGFQIKMHRKALRLSQTALADRLGITFQQIQKYEKGTNRVGASRLQSIAAILGIEVASLFEGSPTNDATPLAVRDPEQLALREFLLSTDGFELNQAFFKIRSADTRRQIVALARSLAEDAPDEDNGEMSGGL